MRTSIFTEAARDLAATETEMAMIDVIETEIRVDDDREADPKSNATQLNKRGDKIHNSFAFLHHYKQTHQRALILLFIDFNV